MTTNQLVQKTIEVPQEQIEKTDTKLNTELSAVMNYRDPGLSLYCATQTKNMEHANALTRWRLPHNVEYFDAVKKITGDLWRGQGEFEGLDEEAGAIAASVSITTAWQEVTDRGDGSALIITLQKALNIYVASEQTPKTVCRGDPFPPGAIHQIACMLGGTVFLAVTVFSCWLTLTALQRRRLRAKQQAAWEEIVDDAEAYATSLRATNGTHPRHGLL